MNAIKLLRCFWKHPIGQNDFKAVNYYIIYERVNHTINANYNNFGAFRMLVNHEDDIDREIYQKLFEELSIIPNIIDFRIHQSETVLYPGYEDKNLALMSNMAFGYDFKKLTINTQTNHIANLSTRIMFTDAANLTIKNNIVSAIPLVLTLNFNGTIPSLLCKDFMNKDKVDLILERENNITF
jgi:hypothetical protein